MSIWTDPTYFERTRERYVILLANNFRSNSYEIKIGYNEITDEWNDDVKTKTGGFIFCKRKNAALFLCEDDYKYLGEIDIPDDARIISNDILIKSDKIVLKEAKDIYDGDWCGVDLEFDHKINKIVFKYLRAQRQKLMLFVIKQNGLNLEIYYDGEDMTNELCLEAVKENGLALQFVKKQTEEICREAVKQNSEAIQFVHEEFQHLFY